MCISEGGILIHQSALGLVGTRSGLFYSPASCALLEDVQCISIDQIKSVIIA